MSWDDQLEELHLQALAEVAKGRRRSALRATLAAAANVHTRQTDGGDERPAPGTSAPSQNDANVWPLSREVRDQMATLGVTIEQVGDVLLHNAWSLPDRDDEPAGSWVFTRHGVVVVVDDASRQVVAVGLNGRGALDGVHPEVAAYARRVLSKCGLDSDAVRVYSPTNVEIVAP